MWTINPDHDYLKYEKGTHDYKSRWISHHSHLLPEIKYPHSELAKLRKNKKIVFLYCDTELYEGIVIKNENQTKQNMDNNRLEVTVVLENGKVPLLNKNGKTNKTFLKEFIERLEVVEELPMMKMYK